MTVVDRFWAKVSPEPNTGCWLWIAATDAHGYGRFGVRAGDVRQAHRVAWWLAGGNVPDGMVLDHLCRMRCCVNPAHLEVVTQATNLLRGETGPAFNAAKTHCKRGHPFDEANGYVDAYRGRERRQCRTCAREREYARWRRNNPDAPRRGRYGARKVHKQSTMGGLQND